MTVTIWHNPRCSKSRDTLALLRAEGLDPQIRLYLKDPPSRTEIADAASLLGLPPIDMMREGEPVFTDLGLDHDTDPEVLIAAMADKPILIERPVVFANGKAVIGRPPEAVLGIL